MSNQESQIQKALYDYESGFASSITQAARFNDVAPSTVRHRRLGRTTRSSSTHSDRRLHYEEERVIVQWLTDLQKQFQPSSLSLLRSMVIWLLQQKGDTEPLGKNYITKFRKRWPQLGFGKTNTLSVERLFALTPKGISRWFN